MAFRHHHHHLALQTFVEFCLLSQVSPSSSIFSCFFLVFTSSFFRSSITFSCHRFLGLVPVGFQSNSFLVGLARSILWICPSHLIFCALMNTLWRLMRQILTTQIESGGQCKTFKPRLRFRITKSHGTIRTVNTTYAAALKTTTHPKIRCRKPYAATQHLMLLMMGVCTRNMSS